MIKLPLAKAVGRGQKLAKSGFLAGISNSAWHPLNPLAYESGRRQQRVTEGKKVGAVRRTLATIGDIGDMANNTVVGGVVGAAIGRAIGGRGRERAALAFLGAGHGAAIGAVYGAARHIRRGRERQAAYARAAEAMTARLIAISGF
jgi:hypothetical protein